MGNTTDFIDKAKDEIYRHGISGLLTKAWQKTSRYLWYTTCSLWYVRDLDDPITPVTPDINLEIEFLVRDKMRLIEWLKENRVSFPWIYFEKEFEASHNHVFPVLTYQGRIIGYAKIGLGPTYIHDFDQTVTFPSDTAFIYDTFILPEYRGKRLARFALDRISLYFKKEKFTKILCHVEKWNVPSIRTFEGAGFRAGESIRFIKLASLPFFLLKGFRPLLNLESHLNR